MTKTYEAIEPRRAAFIGLGVMGYPMAGHLARAGHTVTVFNRSKEKSARFVNEFGGQAAASPREAATGADVVFSCVGNDHDVRSVVLGADGALAGMKSGAVYVDHTTTSAEVARELSVTMKSAGVDFLDAPVSGGQAGAENGALTVMCGGEEAAFSRVRPIAMAFAKAITLVGPTGSGQLAKMVNQLCIAGAVQGLAEGITFGIAAGLDMKLVLDVIGGGAAQSWQMNNRGKTMVDDQFEFGFAVDWMRKDLGLCLDEARRQGTSLPLGALIDQFYADVQRMGGGRWDTSSLIRRLRGGPKGR